MDYKALIVKLNEKATLLHRQAGNALDAMMETNALLHRRTQEAEKTAIRKLGRWHRRLERERAIHRMISQRNLKRETSLRNEVAALRAELAQARAVEMNDG